MSTTTETNGAIHLVPNSGRFPWQVSQLVHTDFSPREGEWVLLRRFGSIVDAALFASDRGLQLPQPDETFDGVES